MSKIVRLTTGFIILFIVGVVHAATLTYTYDSLSRLTGVDYGNGVTIAYTYDAAGNRLSMVSTPSDTTPPTTPIVTDDGPYTTNPAQLHATWAANDPESGIREYQYAIGTTPQGTDVVGWTSAGVSNAVSHAGLNLTDGVTYFISVKARNWVDLWSDVGTSDGIKALSPDGDPDGDGLTNDQEVNLYGTDPLLADTDGDGMPDGWEINYGLDPRDPGDAGQDKDGDGVSNLAEFTAGTDPLDPASHPNRSPVAMAGSDQNALIGSPMTLDGSDSYDPDGDLITFNWTETNKPLGSAAVLSNATVPVPALMPDLTGYYSYDLVVCDTKTACSGPDSVVVYAAAPNVPPNADAGADRRVLTGLPVLLDGTGSYDPDNGPSPLSYLWSFMTVPPGSGLADVNITGRNTPLPSFVPDLTGSYQLDLAVSDGIATTHDPALVTAGMETPPTARAGLDQQILLGQGAILDGLGSDDQDNLPQPMTYHWSFVSLPAGSVLTNAAIVGADAATATFTPDKAGSYVIRLTVSDGLYTGTDNVVVNVVGTLTVSKTGTGSGTVTSSPAGINCGGDCSEPYNYGTAVTLTATPAVGSVFAGWSGACTGTGPCTVTMDTTKAVAATFTKTYFEENDPAVVYTGAWSNYICSACSGGAIKVSKQTGAKAVFAFTGKGVKWIAAKANQLGIAKVYLDGVYQADVDLYSATSKVKQIVYQKTTPSVGSHKIEIRVSGLKNASSTDRYIDLDEFEVIP